MNPYVVDASELYPEAARLERPLHLIVKSLDQEERRQRLIESKKRGRIGRIEHRDIATGLWARVSPSPGVRIDRASSQVTEHQEPRGLVEIGDGHFLLSDVNRVMRVNRMARVEREYTHPFFAFLHSVSFDARSRRFLVVSSGYDCLIEMDLEGNVCWEWIAWEHGFNPALDGTYLCRARAQCESLISEGKRAIFVDPSQLGAYGLMTSQRSNHPNSACYHPADSSRILTTLGHSGEVIEIDKDSGNWRAVVTGLEAMSHAIQPYRNGWMVTNTLKGEFWLLDSDFDLRGKVLTRSLPGKPEQMAQHEWLQAVYPAGDEQFLALDANRGLISIDLLRRQYCIFPVDESWCVHHLVVST